MNWIFSQQRAHSAPGRFTGAWHFGQPLGKTISSNRRTTPFATRKVSEHVTIVDPRIRGDGREAVVGRLYSDWMRSCQATNTRAISLPVRTARFEGRAADDAESRIAKRLCVSRRPWDD